MGSKDIFVKTPIIWRARGVDYNIDHIISVKPWFNKITKVEGLKVRLVNGDIDTICFVDDYEDPDCDCYWQDHKADINQDVRNCWWEWCAITGMNRGNWDDN